MPRNDPLCTFHDPNPPLATARLLRELLLQAHRPRAQAALRPSQEVRP